MRLDYTHGQRQKSLDIDPTWYMSIRRPPPKSDKTSTCNRDCHLPFGTVSVHYQETVADEETGPLVKGVVPKEIWAHWGMLAPAGPELPMQRANPRFTTLYSA